MNPIQFPGAKKIGKPKQMTDEQCSSIWAHCHEYELTGADGKQYQTHVWTEVWKPSEEDIKAIVAGSPIVLQIHSGGLPPVSMFTMDESGNQNAR